jgi:hypothetical protein
LEPNWLPLSLWMVSPAVGARSASAFRSADTASDAFIREPIE